MTGRIVVGIDGSKQSATALEWALARARLGGNALELVNAYTLPADLDFYGYHGYGSSQPLQWFDEYSKELLAAARARVEELAPDLTVTLRSELGPASFVLATASEGAEAVVVGRRGLGAATSILLGSVSNRLTVEAQAPLIAVGEGEQPTSGPVVVGVDGSEFGAAALRFAISEAALRGTTVRAVTAYRLPETTARADEELLSRMRAELEADAAGVTDRALAGLDPGVEVERVSVEGRPADAILSQASDAQLVVVGTHGKGLVRRVLLGSVSRQVLHEADRPVAVVDMPGED
jgi:nucleotide-binding universal stress UspA family protein